MSMKLIYLVLLSIVTSVCFSQENKMELPQEVRDRYHNFGSGSCVQCSIGMCGVWLGNDNAASLLWDSKYGPAEIGGSTPSRVANYARSRGLAIYNVTGDSEPYKWHDWAVKTGRYAAIGAGSRHFQTLYGKNFENDTWYVCNNNSPNRVDTYSDNEYSNLHRASGLWIVILKGPSAPAIPEYIPYWK